MTTQLVPLDRNRHRGLRLSANQPYHYAREWMLCPVFGGELREVCRDYVIVFGETGSVPQALLGTEKGVNAYVAGSGHWLCRYVPAQVRRHPFYLAATPGGTAGKPSLRLAIDEAAPHLGSAKGEPLFNADGTPAPLLEKIGKALADLQRDGEATKGLVAQLDELGLLAPRRLQVRGRDGSQRAVTGVRVVDGRRLAALEAGPLSSLHRSGALMLAYAHLVSLANLRDGVLANPPLQPQAKPGAAPAFSLGETELFDFSRLRVG